MTFRIKKINIITRSTQKRKGNKMKRLNKKEVANLVRQYGTYTAWREKYYQQMLQDNNTEVEQELNRSAYLYWSYMEEEAEIELAEKGIFIYDDLSEKRLFDWDWNEARGVWTDYNARYREAKKAYKAEQGQQEQEESTGAVA